MRNWRWSLPTCTAQGALHDPRLVPQCSHAAVKQSGGTHDGGCTGGVSVAGGVQEVIGSIPVSDTFPLSVERLVREGSGLLSTWTQELTACRSLKLGDAGGLPRGAPLQEALPHNLVCGGPNLVLTSHLCFVLAQGCFPRPSERRWTIARRSSCCQIF